MQSWSVVVVGLFRHVASLQLEGAQHLIMHQLSVLQNISESSHSVSTHCTDVLDAVVNAVDWGTTTEHTTEQAVLDALNAVSEGFRSIAALALVADGGAE